MYIYRFKQVTDVLPVIGTSHVTITVRAKAGKTSYQVTGFTNQEKSQTWAFKGDPKGHFSRQPDYGSKRKLKWTQTWLKQGIKTAK